MAAQRVKVGTVYTYKPVGLDLWEGVGREHVGQRVKVVNKRSCLPANTMGHCYIETLDGEFVGLVLTNSLER